MRTRMIALAACCVGLPLITAADEGNRAVRELDLKGATTPAEGTVERPRVIATAAELNTAFPDAATRTRLAKGVDFDREQFLLFTWSGSGLDKLTPELKRLCSKTKQSEVVFRYTPGSSTDRKAHAHLFVVPKDTTTTWRVETGKGK
jgi:hypothetical protein